MKIHLLQTLRTTQSEKTSKTTSDSPRFASPVVDQEIYVIYKNKLNTQARIQRKRKNLNKMEKPQQFITLLTEN